MSDDLISRQAAIDAIEQHKTAVLEGREWDEGIAYGYAAAHRHLVDIVKQLPSAERHGRWVYGNDFHWYTANCSLCGYRRRTDIKTSERWNEWHYCPNCGASMVNEDGPD